MVELESDPFAIKFAFGIPSSQRLRATTSTYNNSKHIVMGVSLAANQWGWALATPQSKNRAQQTDHLQFY